MSADIGDTVSILNGADIIHYPISIDRSAMMRELKNLTDEGFIKKNGNKIKLLY